MKTKLINFIKYNRIFLFIYKLFGNVLIKFLSIFVRIDNKKILFVSFGGRRFDDSPKALYLAIKNDQFFKDYKLVWAFINPSDYKDEGLIKIKIDSLAFYKAALSSKIWITNSSIQRGLKLKRKKTVKINTWHGTPIKRLGSDIQSNKNSTKISKANANTTYCSQSEYDREIFCRLFNTQKENILLSDLPRNDSLLDYDLDRIINLKKSLNIPLDKKVILYAPTFREFNRDALNNCYIKPPIDLIKWQKELAQDFVLIFRGHYEVVKILGIEENDFIKNFSLYPSLNDLMAISDILVSDYSSIYFDYSILEKPMLNFSYDYDEYLSKRGLYLDLEKDLHFKVNKDEDSLIEEIKNLDQKQYCEKSKEFKNKFAPYSGNACQIVLDNVKTQIKNAVR